MDTGLKAIRPRQRDRQPGSVLVPLQEKPIFVLESQKVAVELMASFLGFDTEQLVRSALVYYSHHPQFETIFRHTGPQCGRYVDEDEES